MIDPNLIRTLSQSPRTAIVAQSGLVTRISQVFWAMTAHRCVPNIVTPKMLHASIIRDLDRVGISNAENLLNLLSPQHIMKGIRPTPSARTVVEMNNTGIQMLEYVKTLSKGPGHVTIRCLHPDVRRTVAFLKPMGFDFITYFLDKDMKPRVRWMRELNE